MSHLQTPALTSTSCGLCVFMRHISLFSGIGGFELAAEWMGWENIASCEINQFGRKVLSYYWPDSYHHDDVHTFGKQTLLNNGIDTETNDIILTGGFPCQPYSTAGKQLGKEDERHLWPEMLRIIREVSPRWIVGENVRGLVSWNGGLVFDEVQTDLENSGYEVLPFLLPACAVNAPHRRDRIWFIAYANGAGREKQHFTSKSSVKEYNSWASLYACGTIESGKHIYKQRQGQFKRSNSTIAINNFAKFPIESPICGGNDGIPAGLDGITVSKHRNESIKAFGNAIVPQVALQIFKAIQAYELL